MPTGDFDQDLPGMRDTIVTEHSLDDNDTTLMQAVDDSIAQGANAHDEGGNYSSIQTADVQGTQIHYSLSTTTTNALADAHQLGYNWRSQHPSSQLPTRPPR